MYVATTIMNKRIDKTLSEKALTYELYRQTPTSYPVPELTTYALMNWERMNRIQKTLVLTDDLKAAVDRIFVPQTWYVLTEGWCGDAAQSVPLLHAAAAQNPRISFNILLRDENLGLMDQYLQNGTSRSIPKLVVVTSNDHTEIFNWGPRPTALQVIYDDLRQKKIPFPMVAEQLHAWYVADKTLSIQQELTYLINTSHP
jgi:hypothetical protein